MNRNETPTFTPYLRPEDVAALRPEDVAAIKQDVLKGRMTPGQARDEAAWMAEIGGHYATEVELAEKAGRESAARIEILLTMCPAEDLRAVSARVKAGTITMRELSETLDCIIAVLDNNE